MICSSCARSARMTPTSDQPPQHRLQPGDGAVDLEELRREHLLAAEREQLPRQRRRLLARPLDLLEVLARGVVGVEPLEREHAVAADRGQEVVEVVRDPTGEPSDRLHLLRLTELLLARPQPRLRALALGDLVAQSGVQRRVLERDRSLAGQHLEHRQSLVRERVGDQVVLDVEHPAQLALGEDRRAEHRLDASPDHVRIGRERPARSRVAEDERLARPAHVVDDALGDEAAEGSIGGS